jgi:hypothetical protein
VQSLQLVGLLVAYDGPQMALPDARAVSAVSAVSGIIPGSRQFGSSAVSGISASEVTIPENDDHADTDGSYGFLDGARIIAAWADTFISRRI